MSQVGKKLIWISEYYPHVSSREKARIRRTLEIGDDPSLRFFPGLRFPHLMSPFFPPTELEWLCFCLFPQHLHILSVESRMTCNTLSARYCWLPKRNKTDIKIFCFPISMCKCHVRSLITTECKSLESACNSTCFYYKRVFEQMVAWFNNWRCFAVDTSAPLLTRRKPCVKFE